MTGQSTGTGNPGEELPVGPLDADSAERIDVHLQRALSAEDLDESNFHVRQARQLLEIYRSG